MCSFILCCHDDPSIHFSGDVKSSLLLLIISSDAPVITDMWPVWPVTSEADRSHGFTAVGLRRGLLLWFVVMLLETSFCLFLSDQLDYCCYTCILWQDALNHSWHVSPFSNRYSEKTIVSQICGVWDILQSKNQHVSSLVDKHRWSNNSSCYLSAASVKTPPVYQWWADVRKSNQQTLGTVSCIGKSSECRVSSIAPAAFQNNVHSSLCSDFSPK